MTWEWMTESVITGIIGGVIGVGTGLAGIVNARITAKREREAAQQAKEQELQAALQLKDVELQKAIIEAKAQAEAKIPDVQATLNAGVSEIVKHYKEALIDAAQQIGGMRNDIERLSQLTMEQSKLLADQTKKLSMAMDTIQTLENHIEELMKVMREHGVPVPDSEMLSVFGNISGASVK